MWHMASCAGRFISQQLQRGVPEAQVYDVLLKNNWDQQTVTQAFYTVRNSVSFNQQQASTPVSPGEKKSKSVAVFWILSPVVFLIGGFIIALVTRLAGISSPLINMLTILIGMAGVILIIVGPVIGIIKLKQ